MRKILPVEFFLFSSAHAGPSRLWREEEEEEEEKARNLLIHQRLILSHGSTRPGNQEEENKFDDEDGAWLLRCVSSPLSSRVSISTRPLRSQAAERFADQLHERPAASGGHGSRHQRHAAGHPVTDHRHGREEPDPDNLPVGAAGVDGRLPGLEEGRLRRAGHHPHPQQLRVAARHRPLQQRRRRVLQLHGDQRGPETRRSGDVGPAGHHQELVLGGRGLLPLRRAGVSPHLWLLDSQRQPDGLVQRLGQRRPGGLCPQRGVGGPGHARQEKRHPLRLLLGSVPGHHLHPPSEAQVLLLHLQPAPPLHDDLLPGPAGLLPAGRLRREGVTGGHRAAGPHRLPAAGGREHAAVRERAAHRKVLHRHHDDGDGVDGPHHLHHEHPPLRPRGTPRAGLGRALHPPIFGPRVLRVRGGGRAPGRAGLPQAAGMRRRRQARRGVRGRRRRAEGRRLGRPGRGRRRGGEPQGGVRVPPPPRLRRNVEYIANAYQDQRAAQLRVGEWKKLAKVMDRFFMWLFFLMVFIMSVLILGKAV